MGCVGGILGCQARQESSIPTLQRKKVDGRRHLESREPHLKPQDQLLVHTGHLCPEWCCRGTEWNLLIHNWRRPFKPTCAGPSPGVRITARPARSSSCWNPAGSGHREKARDCFPLCQTNGKAASPRTKFMLIDKVLRQLRQREAV